MTLAFRIVHVVHSFRDSLKDRSSCAFDPLELFPFAFKETLDAIETKFPFLSPLGFSPYQMVYLGIP